MERIVKTMIIRSQPFERGKASLLASAGDRRPLTVAQKKQVAENYLLAFKIANRMWKLNAGAARPRGRSTGRRPPPEESRRFSHARPAFHLRQLADFLPTQSLAKTAGLIRAPSALRG